MSLSVSFYASLAIAISSFLESEAASYVGEYKAAAVTLRKNKTFADSNVYAACVCRPGIRYENSQTIQTYVGWGHTSMFWFAQAVPLSHFKEDTFQLHRQHFAIFTYFEVT